MWNYNMVKEKLISLTYFAQYIMTIWNYIQKNEQMIFCEKKLRYVQTLVLRFMAKFMPLSLSLILSSNVIGQELSNPVTEYPLTGLYYVQTKSWKL